MSSIDCSILINWFACKLHFFYFIYHITHTLCAVHKVQTLWLRLNLSIVCPALFKDCCILSFFHCPDSLFLPQNSYFFGQLSALVYHARSVRTLVQKCSHANSLVLETNNRSMPTFLFLVFDQIKNHASLICFRLLPSELIFAHSAPSLQPRFSSKWSFWIFLIRCCRHLCLSRYVDIDKSDKVWRYKTTFCIHFLCLWSIWFHFVTTRFISFTVILVYFALFFTNKKLIRIFCLRLHGVLWSQCFLLRHVSI